MLELRDIRGGYASAEVLGGVNLRAAPGEVTALIGRNGVGKTTLLRGVMGLLPRCAGQVTLAGAALAGLPTHRIARAGIGYVPEGRQIFPELTVMENLAVGQRTPSRLWPEERLFALLPNLRERRANAGRALSGGEQQMLAIARALVTDPRVLLLDEPSQGLAPMVVQELARVLRQLAGEGVAVLLVEQNLRMTEAVADRILIMARGQVVHDDTAAAFQADADALRHRWLTM
ncbi:ABC transporter ATP-binding protein [Sediminicoccus rosea]|jgi:branched-chain amino acid transport system ATP-binding protein|uniref:ABC transporter ATP-binding protein n=1 Tax=Sediminicoccus rosea TaxID=1225128 RepID=A0ABZ0PK90_9PROT|nr:ABC transporter ATP-binding protein [Sediminicoccus rosea]WPB85985.1 ABC transporter ATP-binding protein [Sediminicoccus rosea]